MQTPDSDRMLAGDETRDQLAREIIGRRRGESLFFDPRFKPIDRGVVFGIFKSADQRVVFGPSQRHRVGSFCHRYASLLCSMRSTITASPTRTINTTARQSPCRTRARLGLPTSGNAQECLANGSAANSPSFRNKAVASRG